MGGHGTIGSFVGIIRFIKSLGLQMRLKLFDDSVSIFRIIRGSDSSMPEESKMVISAFAESIAWQMGAGTSARLVNISYRSSKFSCLKRVILEVSRTLVKP